MRREVDINEISDGKLYELSDLVKADCGGCEGCHACCTGMGSSIILDPYDCFVLMKNLNRSFEDLLSKELELNMFDGVILPNLKMDENQDACTFLDENGRCSIHEFRPSICRLFPLGRYYEDNGFRYFLQVNECVKANRTKVKVKKWIQIPDIQKHSQFILQWHDFVNRLQDHLVGQDEAYIKRIDMFVLQHFFIEQYHWEEEFYPQFEQRLQKAKMVLKV